MEAEFGALTLHGHQKPTEEKQPRLTLDEMIPVFQRLPTSELIRFISSSQNQPLGKFWSAGLKFVVEKRLPFSLKATANLFTNHVIYDRSGSKVAEIKRPECFYLSPLCKLIEQIELPVRYCNSNGINLLPLRFSLPTLSNLNTLNLTLCQNDSWAVANTAEYGSALQESPIHELLPQFEALSLSTDYTTGPPCSGAFNALADMLPQAVGLKKLSITEAQMFALLTRRGVPAHQHHAQSRLVVEPVAMTTEVALVFLSLTSLTITLGHEVAPERVLGFIGMLCTNLLELNLPLRGSIRDYFAAFQALPFLAVVALDAQDCKQNGFAVEEDDAAVTSVVEFRICLNPYFNDEQEFLAALPKLPNLRSLDIRACESTVVLRLASAICAKGLLRHLDTLKCCSSIFGSSCDDVLQFIRTNNARFPATVDLSQLTMLPSSCDRDFLVAVCCSMSQNTVKKLIFKATVSDDAVGRLREHILKIALDTAGACVTLITWKKDRVCSVKGQMRVAQFIDVKIQGIKTSAGAKGEAFEVQISH